jgi:predicted DNA-binding ribbon-helix-helix protein
MPRLQKKSVTLSGHETSLALEPEFWAVLQAMAAAQDRGLAQLIRALDQTRADRPLASVCRVAALEWALSATGRS